MDYHVNRLLELCKLRYKLLTGINLSKLNAQKNQLRCVSTLISTIDYAFVYSLITNIPLPFRMAFLIYTW